MKKIDMMNKIEEIVENTVELLEDIDRDDASFVELIDDYRFNKIDEWQDSDNFRDVMAHCGGTENFEPSLIYYMSYDRDNLRDTTVYDLKEDLKVVKKLYNVVKDFVENHNDDEEIKTVQVCDDAFVPYYGIKDKEKFEKLPEYKQMRISKKYSLYSTNTFKIKINKYTTFNVEMYISKYQAYNYCIGAFGDWWMNGDLIFDAFRYFRENENIKTIKDLKDYLKKNDNKIFFKYYGKDFDEIYGK